MCRTIGVGKSSLLKILAGLEKPDDGALQMQQGLRLAYRFADGPGVGESLVEFSPQAPLERGRLLN